MAKKDGVSRREFLEKGGLAVGAVAAMPALPSPLPADATVTSKLPHRTLGRTGASVSILAMGCGSRFLMYPADQATAVLEKAVGLGIDYLDTAYSSFTPSSSSHPPMTFAYCGNATSGSSISGCQPFSHSKE